MGTRRSTGSEKGTVLLAVAGMMIALVLFTGLVIDVGVLQDQRGQAQGAADAAAVAGAMQMLPGQTSSWASTAASNTARWNGFQSGTNNTTVTVTPNTGASTVQVQITRNVPLFFMNMLGMHTMAVVATATAGLGPSPACLVALDPNNDSGALLVGGAIALNCGVQVNSTNTQAANWQGTSGCVTATSFNIDGGYYESGGSCSGGNYAVTPQGQALTPKTGQPQVSDPLKSTLTAPTPGTCLNSGITYTTNQPPPGGVIPAGTYCGTLHVNGGTVTFQSGTYVIEGGSLIIDNNAVVTGNGVSFYLTTSQGSSSGSTVGSITFSSNGVSANLSAPTSGSQSGVLFWVDGRSTNSSANQINGQAQGVFNGTIYMPSTELLVTGQSSLNDTGPYSIVAYKVQNNGQGSLNLTRSGGTGTTQQVAVLTQ